MEFKKRIYLIIFTLLIGCQKMTTPEKNLNAPLLAPIALNEIDSRNIVTTLDYQLLINLNLTLLEYDKDTNLVTLLAEDYDIQDKTITFHLKKGVKTISGHEIVAQDAEVSLKRIILNNGSHSRLAELLCNNSTCNSISSTGYELKIIAKEISYIPFILSLLTSADFVIFPTTALSSPLPDSKISNFKETSGPYYIDQDRLENSLINYFEMVINENHFLYNDQMAKKITYTLTKDENIYDRHSLNKNFNYIHNILNVKISQIDNFLSKESNVNIYNTFPLKNAMIFTTKTGKEKLIPNDLIYYEINIRNLLLKFKNSYPNIRQTQTEYFPKGSAGSLRPEQLDALTKQYNEISTNYKPKMKIVNLGLYPSSYEKYKHLFLNNENFKIVVLDSFKNMDDVDFYIDTIDTSFQESLDLLEYNKKFGIFKISNEQMKSYIDSQSKAERIKILQDIHYDTLISGYCLTIGSAPYVTILGKQWRAEPPSTQVGFPVWKITKKN